MTEFNTAEAGKHDDSFIDALFIALVYLFLLSTLFDPSDKVLRLKVPLFVACWGLGIIKCRVHRREIRIPLKMVIYTLLMIAIPVTSIAYYYAINGGDPFEGVLLLKAYLFVSFAMLIYITRIDLLKHLCVALTVLVLFILGVTAVIFAYPELYGPTALLGEQLGIFNVDLGRDYGSGVLFFQMYFVTSPMLAISVAYFFDRAKASKRHKLFFAVVTLMHICAMLIAGTRINILAALLLPLVLSILYARRKTASAFVAVLMIAILVLVAHEFGAFFDPEETSNSAKLRMLSDYSVIFSDPAKLLFGSGLGAYEHWTDKGYTFVTELTYMEIIRNFGIVLGGLMILLLLYPIAYAFVLRPSYNGKSIVMGYAAYLVMSSANPLLFSSMGMMILAVVFANICLYDTAVGRYLSLRTRANSRSGGGTSPSPAHAVG